MPDLNSGYRVTVTRTLTMIGRYRSPESAREFVLGLADSGQLALSDWEEIVTVEPLEVSDADAAAARRRRAEELCAPFRDLTPEQWRDVLILIGAEKRKLLRDALTGRPAPPETP